ncbi:YagK/YfjJ domain-containing protein [Modicisalibacter xianhensis]|nr:inovirus-type Gp2 protein [Halomonas xianhensis]
MQTPHLNERLQLNPHLTKLIDCLSDCDTLLAWIGDKPISVQPKQAREILSELNAALDKFRAVTSDDAFLKEVANQKRASERKRLGFTRYADKLLSKYERLGVVRLDLGYQPNHRDAINFEKAKRHREAYLALRHSHQLFAQWVGYAWAVKYGPVKGYHTNLLLFFDGTVRQEDAKLALSLGELWADKFVEDQGTYFSCSRTDIEERYHARVVDAVSIDDSRSMEGLCHAINSLTKTDDLVRLRLPGNELSFGRGKLRGTS